MTFGGHISPGCTRTRAAAGPNVSAPRRAALAPAKRRERRHLQLLCALHVGKRDGVVVAPQRQPPTDRRRRAGALVRARGGARDARDARRLGRPGLPALLIILLRGAVLNRPGAARLARARTPACPARGRAAARHAPRHRAREGRGEEPAAGLDAAGGAEVRHWNRGIRLQDGPGASSSGLRTRLT